MSFGIIYKAINKVNGKVYIGQTTEDLEVRKKKHLICICVPKANATTQRGLNVDSMRRNYDNGS